MMIKNTVGGHIQFKKTNHWIHAKNVHVTWCTCKLIYYIKKLNLHVLLNDPIHNSIAYSYNQWQNKTVSSSIVASLIQIVHIPVCHSTCTSTLPCQLILLLIYIRYMNWKLSNSPTQKINGYRKVKRKVNYFYMYIRYSRSTCAYLSCMSIHQKLIVHENIIIHVDKNE